MGCRESNVNDSHNAVQAQDADGNKTQHIAEQKGTTNATDELFVNLDDEKFDDSVNIANRKSVRRIITILNYYEEWKSHNDIHKSYGFIEYLQSKLPSKQYNTVALLDDYLNVINLPNHAEHFEDIYLLTTKHISCNHLDCQSLARNNRNREACRNNNQQRTDMYFGYQDTAEINVQQTLDKMHCYFLHSFDRFLKLRRQDMEDIQEQINQSHDSDRDESDEEKDQQDMDATKTLFAIRNAMQNKQKVTENSYPWNGDKFVSTHVAVPIATTTTNNSDDTTDKIDEKKEEEAPPIVYSFGFRYFYWKYYQDNIHRYDRREPTNPSNNDLHPARFQDWYIAKKHDSLKEELLNNNIATISNEQWMNTFEHAQALRDTQWCKRSVFANWNPHWEVDATVRFEESGIENGSPCQVHHLCAILFYTNYDFLQGRFTETYRKLDASETDEALKSRHSNFANWGRYIREMVEIFGRRLSGSYYDTQTEKWKPYSDIGIKKVYQTFYHGIDAEMLFVATIGRLCSPTSTTIAINVALNFTRSSGLCLTLKRYSYDSHLRYFDCSWCSDYKNEEEMLFVGGCEAIKFNTIINTKLRLDYKRYLRALNQLNYFLNGAVEKVRSNKEAFRRITRKKDAVIVYKLITDELIFNPRINIGKTGYNMYHRETLKREIPEYIKTLFRFYCDNMDHVVIDLKETFNIHRQFSFIFSKGNVEQQYGPNNRNILNVDLELICKLFQNIKWIEIKDSNQQNQMFTKNPNAMGSHMPGDHRMVLKDAWLADVKQFFRSKVIREKYNTSLQKITLNKNAINENGDIQITTVCQQRIHEFAIGDWKLQKIFGVNRDLVFLKNS
eukprot:258869_1